MLQELKNMIAACDQNIANYMLIEDQEERMRALNAAFAMRERFEEMVAYELDDFV